MRISTHRAPTDKLSPPWRAFVEGMLLLREGFLNFASSQDFGLKVDIFRVYVLNVDISLVPFHMVFMAEGDLFSSQGRFDFV